jgi:hypothetical protein
MNDCEWMNGTVERYQRPERRVWRIMLVQGAATPQERTFLAGALGLAKACFAQRGGLFQLKLDIRVALSKQWR